MEYNCDVCDKTTKIRYKRKNLLSLTHIEFDKCINIKHTIENPNFFDIDEIFDVYITNHNKKFDLYLVKNVSRLVSDQGF